MTALPESLAMELEHKTFEVVEFKQAATPGDFEAIVAVFNNVDRIGDRIIPGAFKRTLGERGIPPIYHEHRWGDGPIGAGLEAEERDKGLWIKGHLFVELNDPYVNRIWTGMKSTGPREFSFTYQVKGFRYVEEDNDTIRELEDLELFEVGPCLVGMNPDTELLNVASATPAQLASLLKAKAGARNSAKDQELIQGAHDALAEVGAECGEKSASPPKGDDSTINERRKRINEVYAGTRH